MTDFRTLDWQGSTVATATATAPTGFAAGNAYQVKAAAIDNAASPPTIWVLVLDDNHNARTVSLPATGVGPFTFQ